MSQPNIFWWLITTATSGTYSSKSSRMTAIALAPWPMAPDARFLETGDVVDCVVLDALMPGESQCRHCRFFVAMHQAAVVLDIRGEDRHQTSLERRGLHRDRLHPSIK